jgi:hypothetical protein
VAVFAGEQQLTLSPAIVWLGLKNSDDQGTSFDSRPRSHTGVGVLVAAGITCRVTGVTRNPSKAKKVKVPFDSITDGAPAAGDILSVRLLTRIGTNPDDTKCPGHSNAVGLRLYYDAESRAAGFGAGITPETPTDLFLHSNGTDFVDEGEPTRTTPQYKDSAGLKFSGGNPWREIGTWSLTLP